MYFMHIDQSFIMTTRLHLSRTKACVPLHYPQFSSIYSDTQVWHHRIHTQHNFKRLISAISMLYYRSGMKLVSYFIYLFCFFVTFILHMDFFLLTNDWFSWLSSSFHCTSIHLYVCLSLSKVSGNKKILNKKEISQKEIDKKKWGKREWRKILYEFALLWLK